MTTVEAKPRKHQRSGLAELFLFSLPSFFQFLPSRVLLMDVQSKSFPFFLLFLTASNSQV